MEAGKYASEYNRKMSQEEEDKVLAELRESGVTVVDVADITPWQEAVKDTVAEAIKGNEDLYQQILDMK